MNNPSYYSKCLTSFSKACLFAAFLPLVLATHAVGALIIWDAPVTTNINDNTQVLNTGTLFTSYAGSGATPTLNGVTWQTGAPNVTFAYSTGFGTGTATTSYSSLLTTVFYNSNADAPTKPMGFTNLVIGQTYKLQIWSGYYAWDTTIRYSSSAPDGATNSHAPNESGSLTVGPSPNAGQFVIGTFVADATTQSWYYFGDAGSSPAPGGEWSAFQLRAVPVPEPASIALAALGGFALVMRSRIRRRKLIS